MWQDPCSKGTPNKIDTVDHTLSSLVILNLICHCIIIWTKLSLTLFLALVHTHVHTHTPVPNQHSYNEGSIPDCFYGEGDASPLSKWSLVVKQGLELLFT